MLPPRDPALRPDCHRTCTNPLQSSAQSAPSRKGDLRRTAVEFLVFPGRDILSECANPRRVRPDRGSRGAPWPYRNRKAPYRLPPRWPLLPQERWPHARRDGTSDCPQNCGSCPPAPRLCQVSSRAACRSRSLLCSLLCRAQFRAASSHRLD